MKVLSAFFLSLMIANSPAEANSFAEQRKADGKWMIAHRVCGVGINSPLREVAPNDAFQLRRDKMYITIDGNLGFISTTINGQYQNDSFIVHQDDFTISNFTMDQWGSSRSPERRIIYKLETDGSLTIMSGEFGPGGTCPVGNSTLFTNFVRY